MVEDVTEDTQEGMTVIRKILVLLLTVGLFLSAHGRLSDAEKIKESIVLYTKIIIDESKSDRHRDINAFVKMMEDIADHQIAKKLYIWIQSWHENGLYMDAKLKKIEFISIKVKGNTATAQTEELWKYRYFDRRINRIVKPETEVFYQVMYYLERKRDNWVITKIDVIKEVQKNQEGRK